MSGIELQGKIASAFIEIVPRLIRYKVEASHFSIHQGVIDSVRVFLTEIIVFLVRAREYRLQSRYVRWCRAAFSNTFDEILKNIQTCVNNLDRELNSAARQGKFPAGASATGTETETLL